MGKSVFQEKPSMITEEAVEQFEAEADVDENDEDESMEVILKPIEYPNVDFWCSISYYEFDNRVDEPFHASLPFITVDGFKKPSNESTFSIGGLSNLSRCAFVKKTRKAIRKGILLQYNRGDVYAKCLSKKSVFVQSSNSNLQYGWHPHTVCQLFPGTSMKIFSCKDFAYLLNESILHGFEAVNIMTKMCVIKISFVEGWGEDYGRGTVTATPCWISIHLNGPLQWLNQVLVEI